MVSGRVPQPVGFCIQGIPNEDARNRMMELFEVVSSDEGERATSNVMEEKEGRFPKIP